MLKLIPFFLISINLTLAFRGTPQFQDESNKNFMFNSKEALQMIKVHIASSTIYFVFQKTIIKSDLRNLENSLTMYFDEQIVDMNTEFYPYRIFVRFPTAGYRINLFTMISTSTARVKHQMKGPGKDWCYEANNAIFIRNTGTDTGNIYGLDLISGYTSEAFYTNKFNNKPGVFRGYGNLIRIYGLRADGITLEEETSFTVDFNVLRIMDDPGTSAIILEGNLNGNLKICLFLPITFLLSTCFTPGLPYIEAPFYTGFFIYYVYSETATSRVYKRIKRSDLVAADGQYEINNKNKLKFDEHSMPEDPHIVPLLATDRVIFFSDRETEQREYMFYNYNDLVPFMDINSKISLCHDSNKIGVRYNTDFKITVIATFTETIKRIQTLPNSRLYVVFFAAYFIISDLDSSFESSQIAHSITDFGKLSLSLYFQNKEFAYLGTDRIELINYKDINQIIKETIPVIGITAFSVLEIEQYIAVAISQATSYSISILDKETYHVLKTFPISAEATIIRPLKNMKVPNKNVLYYSSGSKVYALAWQGEGAVSSEYDVGFPVLDFVIVPHKRQLAAKSLSSANNYNIKIIDISSDGTFCIKSYEKTLKAVDVVLFDTGRNIFLISKTLSIILIYNLNQDCLNYLQPPNNLQLQNPLYCTPVCSVGGKFIDIVTDKCLSSCPAGTQIMANPSFITGFIPNSCLPDESKTIAFCEKTYGPKCLKCLDTYYLTSIDSVDDSCTSCDPPNIKPSPDLTNGYGRCILSFDACKLSSGSTCSRCIAPLFIEEIKDSSDTMCGLCPNGLIPEFPALDGSDICKNLKTTGSNCVEAFGNSCTRSIPGTVLISSNKDQVFDSIGSCSDLTVSFKPLPSAQSQDYCLSANLINSCKTLRSTGCQECEANYKSSTYMKPVMRDMLDSCWPVFNSGLKAELEVYYDSCSDCTASGQGQIIKSGLKVCASCDITFGFACATCSEMKCLSCISGYFFFKDDQLCCTKCNMAKYWIVDGLCVTCSEGCKDCSGPAKNQCSSCIDGYFLKLTSCFRCNVKCATCSSLNKCTSCPVKS